MTSEKRAQKFHTDDSSLPDLGSAFYWLKQISLAARPIKNTTQIWVVTRHQFLGRHFAEKQWWQASRNVGCFLRLVFSFSRLTRTLIPSGASQLIGNFRTLRNDFYGPLGRRSFSPLRLSLARSFFLAPTTSKYLLRRLRLTSH